MKMAEEAAELDHLKDQQPNKSEGIRVREGGWGVCVTVHISFHYTSCGSNSKGLRGWRQVCHGEWGGKQWKQLLSDNKVKHGSVNEEWDVNSRRIKSRQWFEWWWENSQVNFEFVPCLSNWTILNVPGSTSPVFLSVGSTSTYSQTHPSPVSCLHFAQWLMEANGILWLGVSSRLHKWAPSSQGRAWV